jgi:hypothetical protein
MMPPDRREHRRPAAQQRRQNALPDDGVIQNATPLLRAERPFFVKQFVRYADLPHVMQLGGQRYVGPILR